MTVLALLSVFAARRLGARDKPNIVLIMADDIGVEGLGCYGGLTTDAGTHVPLLTRWTGTIQPAVNKDLVDSTDYIPTLLEAAGRPLSPESKLECRGFYPQLLGKNGKPRDWIYCFYNPRPGWDKDQFTRIVFARDNRYKLYDDGRLYDVPNDKLEENPIRREDDSPQTRNARQRLTKVLKSMEK